MATTLIERPSKETSDRMRKVRSKDTKIERTTERLLRQLYLSYEKQPKMIGHPDFILKDQKIAIFCDSSFWHGRPTKKQVFKTNRLFWEQKIKANVDRDKKNSILLRKLGWKVLRFWDEDIENNPKCVARKIMKTANPLPKKRLATVEMFCGAGGLAHGFFLEGIKIVAGFDIDNTCKYAYEKNNLARFNDVDVENINANEIKKIKKMYPEGSLKILAGCAPCQPFSPYVRTKKKESDKWKLLYSFSKLVNEIKPDIITMENVPTLLSYKNGQVLKDFIDNLKKNGYFIWHKVVKCEEYGVPQHRRRLVLLASRLGEIALLPKTHSIENYVKVRDAIQELPPIGAGGSDKKDPLHRSRNLTPKNMQRIKATREGGDWRSWPLELMLECHKKESGKSFGNVYGRMSWDDLSPTITTEFVGLGTGRFGHPTQNRAISLREAALLQTFPFYYDFIDPDLDFSAQQIATHIGNAVPVRLGQVIAKSIKQHIERVNLA